jgi:hypothetical protein
MEDDNLEIIDTPPKKRGRPLGCKSKPNDKKKVKKEKVVKHKKPTKPKLILEEYKDVKSIEEVEEVAVEEVEEDDEQGAIITTQEGTIVRRRTELNAPVRYYYRTIGELQNKIDEYFSKGEILTFRTKNGEETMTVFTDAGLAYYLGFKSRQDMMSYEKNPKFGYLIALARLRVEAAYEARLHSPTPVGAIFALKNKGWTDNNKGDTNIMINPFMQLIKEASKK